MNIYHNGEYLKNNPGWHDEDAAWKAGKIVRLLDRNRQKPKTVVDVGCGAGGTLVELQRLTNDDAVSYKGFDIAEEAIAMARTRSNERLTFQCGDPFDSAERFELALAIDVMEHVEDCFGFLRKLKVLADRKVLHIPLDLNVQGLLRKTPILRARQKVGHLHCFFKDTALATLEDTGLEVIDWFYTAGALELPNRGMKSALLRFPRKVVQRINHDLAARLLGGYSLMVLAK